MKVTLDEIDISKVGALLADPARAAMSVVPTGAALRPESERTHHHNLRSDLRSARTCYDHLAGKLGVALTDALVQQGVLEVADKDFILTDHGKAVLQNLGVEVAAAAKQRRAFARRCLDWTERRDHLGGALGAAICTTWLEQGLVQRQGQGRALCVTPLGQAQLRNWDITLTPFK